MDYFDRSLVRQEQFYFAGLRVCQYDLVYQSGHTDQYWDGLKTVSMLGGAFQHEPSVLSPLHLYSAFSRSEVPG